MSLRRSIMFLISALGKSIVKGLIEEDGLSGSIPNGSELMMGNW